MSLGPKPTQSAADPLKSSCKGRKVLGKPHFKALLPALRRLQSDKGGMGRLSSPAGWLSIPHNRVKQPAS
jgi:hypothetical protein